MSVDEVLGVVVVVALWAALVLFARWDDERW